MTATTNPPDRAADHVRAVARGGALNLIGSVVYGAAGFALVVVLTRGLGPDAAGPAIVAIAVFTVVRGLAVLGANTGLVRMISRARALEETHDLRGIVRAAVIPVALVGSALGLALVAGAPALARLLGDRDDVALLTSLIRVVAPFMPIAAIATVLVQGSRGFDTMRVQAFVDRIGGAVAAPLVVSVIIARGGGARGALLGWALVNAGVCLAAAIAFRQLMRREHAAATRASADLSNRASVFRPFWAFSLPRALGQACNVAVLWFDTLLISAIRGPVEGGIYAAGTRYLLIGTFTAEAIMQAVGPRVSGLLTLGRRDAAQAVVSRAATWQAGIIVPIYLAVGVFATPLLAIFGPAYTQASTALTVLAFGMAAASLCGPADSVILMSGRSRQSMQNSSAALVVNVVGNLLVVPHFGLTGAGAVWALTLLVGYGLPMLQSRRTLDITTWSNEVGSILVVALATMGTATVLARAVIGDTLVAAATGSAIGAAVYLAVASRRNLLLMQPTSEELA